MLHMKKIFFALISVCIIAFPLSSFAAAENIIINGTSVEIPQDMGKVCEKDGRTFVPVRFVTQYLGCIVNYSEQNSSASITDKETDTSYFLSAGSNILIKTSMDNSQIIKMDTEAFINPDEGRMYIPIRFLAEAMGYNVGWDEETQTVTLNKI